MDVDYNKLKSFIEVVRCGSVTAAARELNRTQSAVSQAIRGLELQLQVKLIEWEGKRLKLTREGQLLYQAAQHRMEAITEELTTIVTAGQEVHGSLEVGLLGDHSTMIQQQVLQEVATFRACYPAVRIGIQFGTSAEIERRLIEQQLDVGFLINFESRYRFQVYEVANEEHIVVTSPAYRQVESVSEVVVADLIDIDEHFTCLTPWVSRNAPKEARALAQRRPNIVVPDFEAMRELVMAGQGIAVIPHYLVAKELKSGALIQVLPALTTLRAGVDCAVEQGRRRSRCLQLFLKQLGFESAT
jgi:DNA-binding transcriptional LysR family regulator